MSKNFVNLTPHEVCFVTESGNVVVPASGTLARVSTSNETIDNIDGIPVKKTVYGEVEGLPNPEANTVYLVSSLVASRVNNRDDVLVPADFIRDEKGVIIGAKSLSRL